MTQNTFFKAELRASSELSESQRCRIEAGASVVVKGAPRLVSGNHYFVKLVEVQGGSPCAGFREGYFFGSHIGLAHPENVKIMVEQDTWIKMKAVPASELPDHEKCFIPRGTEIEIKGRMQQFPANHYHVHIASRPANLCTSFADGYLWGNDIGIPAPAGVEYRITTKTWGKLRLAGSDSLPAEEKCQIPADSTIVVPSALTHVGENHVLVEFVSHSSCPFRTAYVYAPHVGLDFSKPQVGTGDGGSGAVWGAAFASFYRANYERIASQVGFTHNACAAFATTALRAFGVDIPYITWATTVGDTLAAMGWTRITDSSKLMPGDVVLARDAQTAYDGQSPHVWVFGGYSRAPEVAIAIDNQKNGYDRGLNGSSYSPFWYAYRHP